MVVSLVCSFFSCFTTLNTISEKKPEQFWLSRCILFRLSLWIFSGFHLGHHLIFQIGEYSGFILEIYHCFQIEYRRVTLMLYTIVKYDLKVYEGDIQSYKNVIHVHIQCITFVSYKKTVYFNHIDGIVNMIHHSFPIKILI